LATFHARLRQRRGAGIATVATARKLVVVVWHLLTRDEEYRFAATELKAVKQKRLETLAGRAESRTRSSQRGATTSSHDRSRAKLRGGSDPLEPALRHAIDRVQADDTSTYEPLTFSSVCPSA